MPRQRFHPQKLPLLDRIARGQLHVQLTNPQGNLWAPKLYNASRRIKVSKGLPDKLCLQLKERPDLLVDGNEPWYLKRPERETYQWSKDRWKRETADVASRPSNDVLDFMGKVKLLPHEKLRLLRSPSKYFGFPDNVPNHMRKQVNFPDFMITLLRTPHLPAKYATFRVPLYFNKLDLKSYLSSVYNVETIHIRSFVVRAKVQRRPNGSKDPRAQTSGRMYRPQPKKKMTAELVEPFVWPEEPKKLDEWDHEDYWIQRRGMMEANHQETVIEIKQGPDKMARIALAKQAKALLEGKERWAPTWQRIPTDKKVMAKSMVMPRSASTAKLLAGPPGP